MTVTVTTATKLGQAVRARRVELRLNKADAARRANVSRGTWYGIEEGTRVRMLPDTLANIEAALEWPPGHIQRLVGDGVYNSQPITPRPETHAAQESAAELRNKLHAYAQSLNIGTLRQVLSFIEKDDGMEDFVDILERRLAERQQQQAQQGEWDRERLDA